MSAPWPPPPDLESIRELVRTVDPEGHLADGSAMDEYEPEEEAIFATLRTWPTQQLTTPNVLPLLEQIWQESFQHSEAEAAARRPALSRLAEQIARFFGPDARPKVRERRG